MDLIRENLSAWLEVEQGILDEVAHDVANSDSIEEMVIAKQAYTIQQTKVETIMAAMKIAE
ncbi:hypothetical protein C7437_1011061 [Psychrobacillus insolitus]|uniref:Uncharacterized protein n=1 Tax=Psychrobacillus insolitus TaxID=1461 RepID=A0A2W7NBV8_9BACI|nr:hypothetical protein [Psychrobacillus insolitus]PZX07939.1 hypothetical protein C7437_1011061 [Psychrobacillus insolitus]